MNNLKKTPNDTLHKWFKEINEKPSLIKRFDIVELDELRDYLNEMAYNRFKEINNFLIANPKYTWDWAINHMSQYLCTYKRLKSLIDLVNYKIRELNGQNSQGTNEEYFPFKKGQNLELFKEYVEKHIIDKYIDYSYLFQRLKKEKLIFPIKHLEFMEWLFTEGYIKETTYNKFSTEKQFRSLAKTTSANRENNFNNIFSY